MKKAILIMTSTAVLALCACEENKSLVGKWVQPVPNMPHMKQGFVLEEDGKASSVNMATLSYERWEQQNNQLILSGQSIGNHQTITFSDTFIIEELMQDRLVLSKGLSRLEYNRDNNIENETLPQAAEGTLTIGHEVSSLTTKGDSLAPYSQNLQLFREGIRTESVNGEKHTTYILFSQDSLFADLYLYGSKAKERLQRRTLPNGKHVWNIEDDDTKNLSFTDGCWTISQRGKILFKQSSSDNDSGLGNWCEEHYAGTLPAADGPGIRYQLHVRNREHSGDGQFHLQLTYLEANNGKDAVYTYIGKRYTLRGIPANKDATIWQLVSDNEEDIFNFLYSTNELTLLNNNFELPVSKSNYSLKKVL